MPYITADKRADLEPHIRALARELGDEGTLNYAVTRLVHEWLGQQPRYGDYNAAVGVLECAKLELYRTKVASFEDQKAVANGPLPPVLGLA